VSFVDRYVTNGVLQQQSVIRQLLAPDILFDAQDLAGSDTAGTFPAVLDTLNFLNNDALNGLTGSDGPGTIIPTGTATAAAPIVFNRAGVAFQNFQPFFLSEVNSAPVFNWGSFDGTTNAPVVYPSGTSITAIEQQALGGRGAGGGGTVSSVGVWTPSDAVLFPPGTTVGGTTGAGTGTGTTP
jgi:hypothetical protein